MENYALLCEDVLPVVRGVKSYHEWRKQPLSTSFHDKYVVNNKRCSVRDRLVGQVEVLQWMREYGSFKHNHIMVREAARNGRIAALEWTEANGCQFWLPHVAVNCLPCSGCGQTIGSLGCYYVLKCISERSSE